MNKSHKGINMFSINILHLNENIIIMQISIYTVIMDVEYFIYMLSRTVDVTSQKRQKSRFVFPQSNMNEKILSSELNRFTNISWENLKK